MREQEGRGVMEVSAATAADVVLDSQPSHALVAQPIPDLKCELLSVMPLASLPAAVDPVGFAMRCTGDDEVQLLEDPATGLQPRSRWTFDLQGDKTQRQRRVAIRELDEDFDHLAAHHVDRDDAAHRAGRPRSPSRADDLKGETDDCRHRGHDRPGALVHLHTVREGPLAIA